MINYEDVCVFEEVFSRNLEEDINGGELPVKVETNFAPNKDRNSNDAKLELLLEIGGSETDNNPFYYKIRLAGIISWEDMTLEEAKKTITSEGVEVLFSFARTYFYEALTRAKLNAIILPAINAELPD